MPELDIPTLADCGCRARVYSDGSGVDLDYCDLHQAAPQLLKACQFMLKWLVALGDERGIYRLYRENRPQDKSINLIQIASLLLSIEKPNSNK